MATTSLKTGGLTKIYDTGDVQMHALGGVNVEFLASEMTVLPSTQDSCHRWKKVGSQLRANGVAIITFSFRSFRRDPSIRDIPSVLTKGYGTCAIAFLEGVFFHPSQRTTSRPP